MSTDPSLQFITLKSNPIIYFMTIVVTLRLAYALNKFSTYLAEICFAGTIINRIREILDEETMPLITDGQIHIDSSINIQNVSFGYDTEDILIMYPICTFWLNDCLSCATWFWKKYPCIFSRSTLGCKSRGHSYWLSWYPWYWWINFSKNCRHGIARYSYFFYEHSR